MDDPTMPDSPMLPTFALAHPGRLSEQLRHQVVERGALPDRMAVGTVVARHEVRGPERHAGAYHFCFLADGRVHGSRDLAFLHELDCPLVEVPDPQHAAIHFCCQPFA
jgi:hypothetical protein